MKTVKAINRNVRISPDKVRVMAKQIKGMSLKDAQAYLGLSQRKASGPLLKTINSAIANAVNNESMEESTLELKDLQIGESMTYKKPKYRARGRMDIMRTTFSHIRVQVGSIQEEENLVKDSKEAKEKEVSGKKKSAVKSAPKEKKPATPSRVDKKESKKDTGKETK